MKVLILYRPESEHSRVIEEFIHEYHYRGIEQRIEVLSIDTREGAAMASLYDVVQYPAIIVMTNDGSPQKVWQGSELPLIGEVAAYART